MARKSTDDLAKGFALPQVPKRTEVPESAALRFVDGGAGEGRGAKALPAASRLRRTESGERIAVYLPPSLAQQLRVRCAQERRSVSDAVTDAVTAWIEPSSATASKS